MSEKQRVNGRVVPLSQTKAPGQCMVCFTADFSGQRRIETFMWPYEIPEGTPVVVTVEIGKRERGKK